MPQISRKSNKTLKVPSRVNEENRQEWNDSNDSWNIETRISKKGNSRSQLEKLKFATNLELLKERFFKASQ